MVVGKLEISSKLPTFAAYLSALPNFIYQEE